MRNKIKIISNSNSPTTSFLIMNEKGCWQKMSSESELSRKKIRNAAIYDIAEEAISVLKKTYDAGGEGIDIFFEGSKKEADYFLNKIKELGYDNWKCESHEMKVMFVGKVGSGKTTVIEGILGDAYNYTFRRGDGYSIYISNGGNIQVYEVDGIDFKNLHRATLVINDLIERGIQTILYCFATNKVESSEEKLLKDIKNKHCEIRILGLLTKAVGKDSVVDAEKMSNITGIQVKAILAKDLKVKNGIVESYGVPEVIQFIYGVL